MVIKNREINGTSLSEQTKELKAQLLCQVYRYKSTNNTQYFQVCPVVITDPECGPQAQKWVLLKRK